MEERGEAHLDAQALSSCIIELNIARRNAAIYPRGHALVSDSLQRAKDHLQKLLDLREEVVIAVTKDTLVVDQSSLAKENPVFREFARSLRQVNIACVRFRRGVTEEEIYSLQRFLAEDRESLTAENAEAVTKEHGFRHIALVPVDYGAFTLEEGKTRRGPAEEDLLAQYVKELLDGNLDRAGVAEGVRRIPPEKLAEILNGMESSPHEESYDRVITTYLRSASEKAYTGNALQRLMTVIDGLGPRLKQEFLASTVKNLAGNANQLERALKEIPDEKVLDFFRSIERGKVSMPKVFRSLIERFSELKPEGLKELGFRDGVMADDFFLSQDVVDLLDERRYDEHIPLSYREELQKILSLGLGRGESVPLEFGEEWDREQIDREYSQILLELLAADVAPALTEKGQERLTTVLKGQLRRSVERGEYGSILQTLTFLEQEAGGGRRQETLTEVGAFCDSEEFASLLVRSLREVGRQHRQEAVALCRRFAPTLAPLLMEGLAEEESRFTRKFLLDVLTELGAESIQPARDRLRDERWFVRRNMVLILCECGGEEVLEEIRPYCRDDDGRVRTEALRCLLGAEDEAATETLRKWLFSGDREKVEQAIHLAGTYKVRRLVPELLAMLGSKAKRGKDYEVKIHLVRALGLIGDPRAMDSLRDVLSSSSLFFRADLEKLKRETYKVMEKFLVGSSRETGHGADGR